MDNKTFSADTIYIEGLKVNSQSAIPAFILLLFLYIFILVSNVSLAVLIFMERSLHEPMYLLFCNMSINDAFGATAIIPRLVSYIFTPITDRYIHYYECVVQAFCAHFHAGTSHVVLIVMAFDRYVAICNPLRYATIMTHRMVVKLSLGAWFVPFIIIVILMGLTLRLTRCRRAIIGPYCDNPSLFKLSCQDLLINHIYGLGSAMIVLTASLGSVVLTYLRIAIMCFSNKNKTLNSKALQTCATHLTVYIIMLASSLAPMIIHRYPQWADIGKVASILFVVIPGTLDPIIYGLQCKELRQKIVGIFHKNKVTVPFVHSIKTGQTLHK